MNTKILSIILSVLVVILALGWFMSTRPTKEPVVIDDKVNTMDPKPTLETPEPTVSEAELVFRRLPRTVTVGQRVVVIDRSTVSASSKNEYSSRTAGTLPLANEDPVDYVEKILRIRLGQISSDEPLHFFKHEASLYPLGNNGVSAFIRVSTLPDDSVGASEERFDLIFRNSRWELDWYGKRNLCQRMEQTFWSPADQLCP